MAPGYFKSPRIGSGCQKCDIRRQRTTKSHRGSSNLNFKNIKNLLTFSKT